MKNNPSSAAKEWFLIFRSIAQPALLTSLEKLITLRDSYSVLSISVPIYKFTCLEIIKMITKEHIKISTVTTQKIELAFTKSLRSFHSHWRLCHLMRIWHFLIIIFITVYLFMFGTWFPFVVIFEMRFYTLYFVCTVKKFFFIYI